MNKSKLKSGFLVLNKRFFAAIILVLATVANSNGQLSTRYTYSSIVSNYTPLGVSATAITPSVGNLDDGYATINFPAGFTFWFEGVWYTSINVSTNGMATFGSVSGVLSTDNAALFSTSTPFRVIAPWWDNLLTVSGTMKYFLGGTAPLRSLYFEWTNVRDFNSGTARTLNFQLVLHENSNMIEFRYGSASTTTATSGVAASIGIKGATGTSGDYFDGATGSSTSVISTRTVFPPATTVYRFTPLPTIGATLPNLKVLRNPTKFTEGYYIVSGDNLNANVTVSFSGTNTNFEIRKGKKGVKSTTSITLLTVSRTVRDTIYYNLRDVSIGEKNISLLHSSTGATPVTVQITGAVEPAAVTLSTSVLNEVTPVILTYNANYGWGNTSANLKDFIGDVYLYAGYRPTIGNQWSGAPDWVGFESNPNLAKLRMTRSGSDPNVYTINLGYLRDFFGITDPSTRLYSFEFLFRNLDGSKTGRDIDNEQNGSFGDFVFVLDTAPAFAIGRSGTITVPPTTTSAASDTISYRVLASNVGTSGMIAVLGSPDFEFKLRGESTYQFTSGASISTRIPPVSGFIDQTIDIRTRSGRTVGTKTASLNHYLESNSGIVKSFSVSGLVSSQPLAPTVSLVTPVTGAPGTSVTIIGTRFNADFAQNAVWFGSVKGAVTSASTTRLEVTVPHGATYSEISVTNLATGLTGNSFGRFLPTFDGTSLFPSSLVSALPSIVTGGNPYDVEVVDFDGDGKVDVLVATTGINQISFHRNTSTSTGITFADRVFIPTAGQATYSIQVSDLDGDGKKDLVMANAGDNSFSVLRNTSTPGTLSFGPRQDYSYLGTPYDIAISDFDGDGKADVAIASFAGSKFSVFRNMSSVGTINLSAQQDFSSPAESYAIASGDVNRDGKSDLLVAHYSSGFITVQVNNSTVGSISFTTSNTFSVGANVSDVAIMDLDSDAKPELVTTVSSANRVSIFKNTWQTGFTPSFGSRQDYSTAAYPKGISAGDLNGDGKPELAIANLNAAVVTILNNTSSTTAVNFDTKRDFDAANNVTVTAMADLNNDGKTDFLAISLTERIHVFQNAFVPPTLSSSVSALTGFAASNLSPSEAKSFTITGANLLTSTVSVSLSGVESSNFEISESASSGFTNNAITIAASNGAISNKSIFVRLKAGTSYGVKSTSVVLSSGDISRVVSANGVVSEVIPQIAGISPAAATPGSSITLSGSNFSPTVGSYQISLVGTVSLPASVTAASATTVTFTIPANAPQREKMLVLVQANGTTYQYASSAVAYVYVLGTETIATTTASLPIASLAGISDENLQARYRLVSVPGRPISPVTVGLREVDITSWRMFRWTGTNNQEMTSPAQSASLGEGVWLLSRNPVSASASTQAIPISDNKTVITVRPGWNIIGNPFTQTILWNEIRLLNNLPITTTLRSFNSGSYPVQSSFVPYEAYFVQIPTGVTQLLIPKPGTAKNVAKELPRIHAEWTIGIGLNTSASTDSENFIGIAKESTNGRDAFELSKPPLVFDLGFLYFNRPDWDSEEPNFSEDFRPEIGNGQTWTFDVRNKERAKSSISLEGLAEVPVSLDVFLLHPESGLMQDMRRNPTFVWQNNTDISSFEVVVGPAAFIRAKTADFRPATLELSQNYPNPFNPTTTIRYSTTQTGFVKLLVVDINGRKIAELVNSEKSAGYHVATFNASGMASGIYLYRLETPQGILTRKMVLVK